MSKDFLIKISDFTGIFRAMAEKANDNSDGVLDYEETSVFNMIRKTLDKSRKTFVFNDVVYDASGREYNFIAEEKADALKVKRPDTYEEMQQEQKNLLALKKADSVPAAKKNSQRERIKKIMNNNHNVGQEVDADYWADIILKIQKKYKIPAEVLTTIIRIETNFEKNIGAAGITTIAAEDIIQREDTVYNKISKDLTYNILYDEKGKKRTAREIMKKCYSDDYYAATVATMCFAKNYTELAAKMNPKTAEEREEVLLKALGDYNVARRETYIKLARKHLKFLKYDYNNVPFR